MHAARGRIPSSRTNMDAVQDRLRLWGFDDLIPVFEDNGIDEDAFELLDKDAIKMLIPNMGKRLKFCKRFDEHAASRRVAHQILLDISPENIQALASGSQSCQTLEGSVPSTSWDTASSESFPSTVLLDTTSSVSDTWENDSNEDSEEDEEMEIMCSQVKRRRHIVQDPSPVLAGVVASLPQKKKSKTSKFDVIKILSQSAKGERAICDINKHHVLTPRNGKSIAQLCAAHLVRIYGDKPSSDVKEDMAESIITAFPCLKDPEGKGYEQWYAKGSAKRPAYGSLECHLKYLRRANKTRDGSLPKPAKAKKDEEADPNSTGSSTSYDVQEMTTHTEWMKHNKDPSEVKAAMKCTVQYRRDFIHSISGHQGDSAKPDLDEILEMFPRIMDQGMIQQDYAELFPRKANLLYQKWPALSTCVLVYANGIAHSWKRNLHVEHRDDQDFTDDERINLAFFVLAHLFEGRKSEKGGRASCKETLECFIDFQKEGVSVANYLKKVDGKTRSQPFILAIGGDFTKPGQCFVIIERQALECDTLLGAVDLCYKAHQVLDLKYAPQVTVVWNFMDNLVYDVEVPNEVGAVRAFRAYYHFSQS